MDPRTPTTFTFVGAKGGVGTSTIAVAHAFRLGRCGRDVRLTATDPAGLIELSSLVTDCPPLEPGHVVELDHNVTLADHLKPGACNVVDGGTDRWANHRGLVLVVVRNSALALRSLLTVPRATRGIVMVNEHDHRPVEEELQRMCSLITWAKYFGTDTAPNRPAVADTGPVPDDRPVSGLLADRAANRIRLAHPIVAQSKARRYIADAANEFGLSTSAASRRSTDSRCSATPASGQRSSPPDSTSAAPPPGTVRVGSGRPFRRVPPDNGSGRSIKGVQP